jgi:hypothetical protein
MARRRPINKSEPDNEALLRQLDRLARLLDERFVIPGTNVRAGLDALIGLIPGVGDLVTGGLSIYILLQARRFKLPWHVQARMLANIGVDVLVGSVPIFGDVFDVAFRSNRRNMNLLRRHLAGRQARPSRR